MGSSDESTNETQPTPPRFTNPLSAAFLNLFGVPVGFDRDLNSFQIEGVPSSGFAGRMFGPSTFDVLSDQLAPTGESPFAQLGAQNLQGADTLFGSAINLFQNDLIPGAQDLAQTGFRTDVGPIRDRLMREFQQETIPGLANQFSTLGGGGQNQPFSDFNQAALRAGGDVFSNIGALQVQADEAAAGRRTQGLGFLDQFGQTLAGLGAQRASFPVALGGDIAGLREQEFDLELLRRPGGQLLNFFNNLLGTTQPDPILLASSSQGERDAFSIL